MKAVTAYTAEEARTFCSRWLPAWTGNDPEHLAKFYADDLFYSDPTVPQGLSGKPAFLHYMTKLLGDNPKWIWRHESSVPLENGFLNHWRADIPVGWETIVCRGVCSVQLHEGLIFRNQVFFDTSALVTAIRAWNKSKRS
jgi:hypothetical protein